MDQSLIYLLMMLNGIIIAALPFGVYMGGSTLFGLQDPASSQLLLLMFVCTLCLSYLVGLGSMTVIQHNSCGKVKNMKQIAGNAGLSTLVITLVLALAVYIPGLKGLVTGLLPPSLDPLIIQSIGYSYFLFWGAVYGVVVGGYLSANCGD
jgi:hypothetical protein